MSEKLIQGVEQIAGGLLHYSHLTLTTPSPDLPLSTSSSQKYIQEIIFKHSEKKILF